jgi:signal transduction histidine kinase/DNA-binding response OmpR family regulator
VISAAQLEQLFSIVLDIDANGIIARASDTFTRHMPDYQPGADLLGLMQLTRPSTVDRWEDLEAHMESLFLLTSNTGDFAIRGQLLKVQEEPSRFVFCGSPWLTWISVHSPNTHLGISDFAPQDSQLDQLFLMTTEKRMVNDLERLNSALKQAKRETELAQEARSALFARMSHEMRTPLNGVVSALSILSDAKLEDEASEVLRLAEASSKNLLHVINYVLDLSKIEAHDTVLENVVFDLHGLLEGVADVVRVAAAEKSLELRWEVDAALASLYSGDKPKLRQCLINLLSNAIKFTDEGKVTLRVIPSPRYSDGQKLRFEVEDTGIGIHPTNRKRIFDPFWTGASSVEKGTGLGLDIVRRSVEMMGGIVGVVSAPGSGSVFWIDVPLREARESDELAQHSAPTLTNRHGAAAADTYRGTVLLVDDNETNLILGRKILESMGVDVEVARSGEEALSRCDRERYDLVFMDISMPGMDGVYTTIKLRERFDASQLPVVALTAYASTAEEKRCLDAGMNHYLIKPIVREQLAEQLACFLDRNSKEVTEPAQVTKADHSLINTQTLQTLIDQIGSDALQLVIDEFRGEAPLREEHFQAAVNEGSADAAQREAHTLGSTCLSLGLDRAAFSFRSAEASLLERGDAGFADIDATSCGKLLKDSLRELERQLQTLAA